MIEQSAAELITGLSQEEIARIKGEGEAAYHVPEWTMNPYRHDEHRAKVWRAGWKLAEKAARAGNDR